MRATVSVASSPAPSPRQPSGKSKKAKTTKRSKSKADMAGLVGGDSDSSALTQESGDEGSRSVVTGTDAATDSEEDQPDVQEASPGKVVWFSFYSRLMCSGQSKAARGRVKQLARGGAVARTRAGSTSNARGTKKRKK